MCDILLILQLYFAYYHVVITYYVDHIWYCVNRVNRKVMKESIVTRDFFLKRGEREDKLFLTSELTSFHVVIRPHPPSIRRITTLTSYVWYHQYVGIERFTVFSSYLYMPCQHAFSVRVLNFEFPMETYLEVHSRWYTLSHWAYETFPNTFPIRIQICLVHNSVCIIVKRNIVFPLLFHFCLYYGEE